MEPKVNCLLRDQFVDLGGIQLHVKQAGPEHGQPVLLLHGFPEFWYGWRHQIPPLAMAGYRVIVPDQRGYNLSDKRPRVADYAVHRLTEDVAGLLDALDCRQVNLVGHDWGGGIAWWFAQRFPDRVKKLVVLNCPHGDVFVRHLTSNPRQMLRSWYILWFQLPVLPEWIASWRNWQYVCRALRQEGGDDAFSDEDLEHYRQAWSQPGAFRAMINWYRALLRHRPKTSGNRRLATPTLLIWGAQDRALGREMAPDSIAMCDNGRLELIETAGHFVQHDAPARVNELLLKVLDEPASEI